MSVFTTLRTRIPLSMIKGSLFGAGRFPGLTQVLTSRNDNYGEQPVERLIAVIDWNRKYFKCKTVFVEWNPPADSPLLSKMLVEKYEDVVCYVVSHELHSQVAGDFKKPFIEYNAKNVGIRRAESEWVLVGNSDVIVGTDILNKLNEVIKDPDNIIRTRRVDIPFSGSSPSFIYILDGRKYIRFRTVGGVTDSAPGDCTIASRDLWFKARGYDEGLVEKRVYCDVRGMHQLVECGGRVNWIGTHFHFDHPESTSLGVNDSHGAAFDPKENIPYRNSDDWGLINAKEELLEERIHILTP